MKKALYIFGGIIALFLLLAILLPIIFQDQIKEKLTEEINKNVKAEVYFDKFGLSFFNNFPHITASLSNFGVKGINEFEGDTLADIASFRVVLNLKSVLFGDQIQVNRIELTEPELMILVLEDGTANYDIAVDTGEETPAEDTTATTFNVSIESWEVKDAHIAYYDLSTKLLVDIKGLNHQGSGDFTQDIFDLTTYTQTPSFTLQYDDVSYMSEKEIEADVILEMNMPESKYTFKENQVKVNDFGFGFDGFIAMPTEDIQMDISFASQENTFKSLLSLVPGVFVEGYEDIQTEGSLQFDGYVKGTYSEEPAQMPGYQVNLKVNDGYVKYPDYPVPISNINFTTNIENPTGEMKDAVIEVPDFKMELDNKPFSANLLFRDLDNYQWRLAANGTLDLTTIMKMIEMPDMTLQGIIEADLKTAGNMTALENEQYDQLPTEGSIAVRDFYFQSEDLPQGFAISQASTTFNPSRISIEQFEGKVGSSDLNITGYVANYLAYALEENATLEGKMTLTSQQFNANEWMVDEEEDTTATDTTELEVVKIPEDIDFTFSSSIGKVLYDNLELNDVKGTILIKDGILSLENLNFNTLGGQFAMSGSYNTQDIERPLFDFDFNIEDLSFSQAYQNFNTIQTLAPIAEKVNGKFSTDFKIAGELQQNMMPNYSTLVGQGLIEVLNAAVTDSKIISGITSLTNLDKTNEVTLSDVILNAEVTNGRIFFEPFDFKLGNIASTVYGSNGIDGSLDYIVKLDVPAGQVGQAINQAIASLSGSGNATSSNILVNLAVGGDYSNPKVKLAGTEAGESTKSQAQAALKNRVEAEKEEIKEEVKEKVEEQKEVVKEEVQKEKEKLEEKAKEEVKEEVEKAKDKLKKFFKGSGGN